MGHCVGLQSRVSEDIREYCLGASSAASAAGAGALSIRDASDAASAAVAGVQDPVDTQSTANEETELVAQPPRDRDFTVQRIPGESMYFVRLREHCFAVAERFGTELELMQVLYNHFAEYGAEPLLYTPGEGVMLRRVGAVESNLVRRAMIRFTCACGHTNVSTYFTFDKSDLTDDYLASAAQGGKFVIYFDYDYTNGTKAYAAMRNEVHRLMGNDNIRLFTVQGDTNERLAQRYADAGRQFRSRDAIGHLHAKTMRLGSFNLDTSANGTTSTEGNHERGSLVHLTERGLENAVSLDSRLAFHARPLVRLGDYQPSRPNVPAAGTLYEQPAQRTS